MAFSSKVIIVEGMDNTGKSTLIKRLAKALPKHRMIISPGPNQADQPQWIRTEIGIARTSATIYDRHPLISEEIYGPRIRGISHLTQHWPHLWDMLVRDIYPTVIYCRPPRDEIIKTILEREQMEGVVENARTLIDMYDRFISEKVMTTLPVYAYDFTNDPKAHNLFHAFGI